MKTAFLFSGQGAQYPGMMRDLYDNIPSIKELFNEADRCLNRQISKICFEGTQEELNSTVNTQPCMLAGDLAAALALKVNGIKADAVAGFSLGEYAALAFAGAIDTEDAFRVIQIRANAMQEAVPIGKGAMAAFIGATAKQVEEICDNVSEGYVAVANYNSHVQTVVSGTVEGVDTACVIAEKQGLICMKLAVSAPFHCALMEPAAERLKHAFSGIEIKDPDVPVYMNVDGMPIIEGVEVKEKLIRQAMCPVRWTDTLEKMKMDGIDTFIECGPGKTLTGLVKKTLKDVNVLRVEDLKTLNKTLEQLK